MSIIEPGIRELRAKTDSAYTLVVQAARRARQLVDGQPPLVDPKDRKPLTVAIDEINRELISFHRRLEDEQA